MSDEGIYIDQEVKAVLLPHLVKGETLRWAQCSRPSKKSDRLRERAGFVLWFFVAISFVIYGGWRLVGWASAPAFPAFSDLSNLFWFALGVSASVLLGKKIPELGEEPKQMYGITDRRVLSIVPSSGIKETMIGPLAGTISLELIAGSLGNLTLSHPNHDDVIYMSMYRVTNADYAERLITKLFLKEANTTAAKSA